jgi:hypothetical protein
MFNESFVHIIHGITGHLRQQKNLIQKMKATCPRFIDTRWLSTGRLLDWLIDKRRDLQERFEQKSPPCRPPDEWRIEAFALASVVEATNTTFRVLQGQQLHLDQQKEYLENLRQELMQMGNVITSTSVLTDVPDIFK